MHCCLSDYNLNREGKSMKKRQTFTLGALVLTILGKPFISNAQEHEPFTTQPQSAYLSAQTQSNQAQNVLKDVVMEEILSLQREWAHIKYQISDKRTQIEELKKLANQAQQVSNKNQLRAEPKIWQAIILSTKAGIEGGLGALSAVKQAEVLLEEALQLNENALDGSAHTSLGALYYQVPGWPIGFGDDQEAEKHLRIALQMNPNGIDPNFFYGDFLIEEHREQEARGYLERALMAPERSNRELADAGRRQEIKAKLSEISTISKTEERTK